MVIKKLLAKLVMKISIKGAGMPSLYGSYEPFVPYSLQSKAAHKQQR